MLPLVERVASELSHWLGSSPVSGFSLTPSSGPLRLVPDLDTLPALASEREALWASLEKTSFLTTEEKRAIAGFSASPANAVKRFNPGQLRVPAGNRTGGQWTNGDGGNSDGDDGDLVHPVARRPRGDRPRPPRDHNKPPEPLPPPVLPPGSTGDAPSDDDLPDFLRQKPGTGSLSGDRDSLTPQERIFAQEMEGLGNHVQIVPREDGARTADLRINGKVYELKTVSGVTKTDLDSLSGTISSRVLDARGQSGDIIIDARRQQGMTREIAERSINRAYGADKREGIQSIVILTNDGVVHAPRRR